MKVPNEGYCIASRGVGLHYDACFSGRKARQRAFVAARKIADGQGRAVEIIRVENRGTDRYIVDEVVPSWQTGLRR